MNACDQFTILLIDYGCIAVFIAMFLNGLISAPPSEVVLGLSGVAALHGAFPLALALLAGITGNLLGTLFLFFLARRYVKSNSLRYRERLQHLPLPVSLLRFALPSAELIRRYEIDKRKLSLWWLCYCRCLPVIRSAVSVPAGVLNIPIRLFTAYTLLGVVIWCASWVSFGFYAGIMAIRYGKSIFLAAFLLGGMVVYLLRRTHQVSARGNANKGEQSGGGRR